MMQITFPPSQRVPLDSADLLKHTKQYYILCLDKECIVKVQWRSCKCRTNSDSGMPGKVSVRIREGTLGASMFYLRSQVVAR